MIWIAVALERVIEITYFISTLVVCVHGGIRGGRPTRGVLLAVLWIALYLLLPWIAATAFAIQPTGGSARVLYWTGIVGASTAVWLIAIEAMYHYLVDIDVIPKHGK